MDNKQDYLNYLERMKRYNDFEKEYNSSYDEKTRIAQVIALFEFGYQTLPKEKIKLLQDESLNNKIKIQRKFAEIAKNQALNNNSKK